MHHIISEEQLDQFHFHLKIVNHILGEKRKG